jgi:hypothetical protein
MQQWVFSLWSVHGLYSRAATGTAVDFNNNMPTDAVFLEIEKAFDVSEEYVASVFRDGE